MSGALCLLVPCVRILFRFFFLSRLFKQLQSVGRTDFRSEFASSIFVVALIMFAMNNASMSLWLRFAVDVLCEGEGDGDDYDDRHQND